MRILRFQFPDHLTAWRDLRALNFRGLNSIYEGNRCKDTGSEIHVHNYWIWYMAKVNLLLLFLNPPIGSGLKIIFINLLFTHEYMECIDSAGPTVDADGSATGLLIEIATCHCMWRQI